MNQKSESLPPTDSVSLFVKRVLLYEGGEKDQETVLTFYADGYPGLLYHESDGLHVQPHNKQMPLLFLYGQTIAPIHLHVQGQYRMVVFQLYPFLLKSFFNITAKTLNDACYDLGAIAGGEETIRHLHNAKDMRQWIRQLSDYLLACFEQKQQQLDLSVRKAIETISNNKGQMSIQELCDQVHLTPRTLERRFAEETGLSPKQFARILQFQNSLEELSAPEFRQLNDVVYNNGYADQSHFIRVFKAFTHTTPGRFLSERD